VLSYTILALVLLLALTLVEVILVTTGSGNRRVLYIVLITILLSLLLVAFFLNRSGHYTVAAQIAVACGMIGPWGAVFFDQSILQGDFIPLVYTSLSLFLAAILLPVRQTVILAVIEFAALLSLSFIIPASAGINWPSLLAFIFFTSILSVVSTFISHRDMMQIDIQMQLLTKREAQMRELSVRDPLTGLYNRRFLEETVDQRILLAQQEHTPLSLIIADVDHFKRYNDLYGHVEGDTMLRLIGAALRSRIRSSDMVCRFGGEEFVIVLPGASLDVAQQRADFIRGEVKQIQEENRDQIPSTVTISIGVACYPQHGQDRIALLRAADEAMYRAKDNGRDRVEIAS
jgi:diguanylate cyclase (GGDEF)-like protein